MIIARAEIHRRKPAYRRPFDDHRCLILASGFYEWDDVSGARVPHYFRMADGSPFAMAGIWDRWRSPDGQQIESGAIVTTDANGIVAPVHGRMPVILPKDDWDRVARLRARPRAPRRSLHPLEADRMSSHPVSRLVNNPRNDDPRCVERAEPAAP